MHLDRRTVSRKTPGDGKLEISRRAAEQLAGVGGELRAEWDGRRAGAALISMACSCGSDGGGHEHFFLESTVFRGLPVGREVDLAMNHDVIHVTVTPSP